MQYKVYLMAGLFMFLAGISYGQEKSYSASSLKLGVGLGISDGLRETGAGSLWTVGYQRNFWKNRLRLNPAFRMGLFSSRFATDTRDMYYNTYSLEVNAYLDVIRYKGVSLFVGAGGVLNNSRGLLGTGGEFGVPRSEYYSQSYVAAHFGGGLRINPKNSPVAIDLMPVNIQMGTDYFLLGFFQLAVDVKLK